MKRSRRSMPSLTHCIRNSGAASTWTWRPSMTTWMEVLVLLLRGSVETHTAHEHPIMGTPCDVPLPSMITSMFSADDCERSRPTQGGHQGRLRPGDQKKAP